MSADLKSAVEKLERRAFTTYLARLKAYERLARRNNAWNASLIALATSTTISAVGLLADRDMYGSGGDGLMVALAILSLVASLVVSSVNYGSRSRAMEAGYKRIQQISISAEGFFVSHLAPTSERFVDLQKEYGVAVEFSENHTRADHIRANRDTAKGNPAPAEGALSRAARADGRRIILVDNLITLAPYATLSIPIALLIPFVSWFAGGFH
ncbi:hypothetical protein GCM10022222_75940 [Amycolatopsis ultiminotia]|uniref:SMODS and SLOG-associating 2TM effector domain-containing protein n=1 Tax=Amycolatopsis ultiminotia TaxID=543629 RepID=A0ABP6YDI9_9PSEU